MRYWKNLVMVAATALLLLGAGIAMGAHFGDHAADASRPKIVLPKRVADAAPPFAIVGSALLESTDTATV